MNDLIITITQQHWDEAVAATTPFVEISYACECVVSRAAKECGLDVTRVTLTRILTPGQKYHLGERGKEVVRAFDRRTWIDAPPMPKFPVTIAVRQVINE